MAEDNSGGLAGLDIGGSATTSTPAPASGGSAAENVLGEVRTKRKYTKRSEGNSIGKTQASIPPIPPELFAKLYSPALWGKVLCAPADALALTTGSKTWEVGEKEREMLGDTGSVAAQCFATYDPRYLALSLCVIAIIDVYAMRFAMWKAEQKEKARSENNK